MAVTIHDEPQHYTPSDNPVNWTFSSDQTAQQNFSYLVEIYIDGLHVANEIVFPDNGIYGRFNASSYASNACSIPVISSNITEDALNYATVSIIVIERYGDPIVDNASATSTTINVFKAKLEDEDFVSWLSTSYDISVGSDSLWLQNFPGGYSVIGSPLVRREDESFRIMTINDSTNLTDLVIELYDSDNNLVATDTNTYTTVAYKITVLNLTPSVVIAATSLTQTNFDDSAYMKFYITGTLQAYHVTFNENCNYQYYKRINFLTKLGTIEALSFDLISREKASIESFGYRKSFGEWSGSSFLYANAQGRDIDYAKVSERSLEVLSDWLPQDVQHWLIRNLYENPVVWVEVVESTSIELHRRKATNTGWRDEYHENDMLFQERLELKLPTYNSMVV